MNWNRDRKKQMRGKIEGYRLYASVTGHEDVILATSEDRDALDTVANKVRALPEGDWFQATSQWHHGPKVITVKANAITAMWVVKF